jgi:hypothetical protein
VTVIEADPSELVATAGRLGQARQRRLTAAADLRGLAMPEMPPGLEGYIEGVINSAASGLTTQAGDWADIGRDLASRAMWAIIAGYGVLRMPGVSAMRGLYGLFSNGVKVAEQRRLWQMLRAWSLYQSEVAPIAARGERSMEALRAFMLWQQELSRIVPHGKLAAVLAGEGDAAKYMRIAAGPLKGLRGTVGKVTPFISMITSTDTMIRGSTMPGWRGDVDRYVVAPVTLGASGVAGASALGIIALTPGGQIVVGAVLIGAGVWVVGNIAWDHRKEIAHAVAKGGKFVVDHPIVAGPVAVPYAAGKEIYDHRHEIAHAVVSSGEFAVDQVSKTPGRLKDAGETILDGATSAPGKIVGLFH